MARVNIIPDGQPLTYELINAIIEEVNKIKDIPEDFGQQVKVWGPGIQQSEEQVVKVVSGVKQFELKSKDINTVIDINFDKGGNFNTDNVVVTASIVDRAFGNKGGGAQMANVTITNISNTGFQARVQILKSVKQNISLELHYIAVGAGPKLSG